MIIGKVGESRRGRETLTRIVFALIEREFDESIYAAYGGEIAVTVTRSTILAGCCSLLLIGGGSAHAQLGKLVAPVQNPSPDRNDRFGASVAAFGDLLMVGSPRADDVGEDAGAVYLYDGDGVLVQTIYSPTPDEGDWFGSSVSSIGDRILVGASRDDTWSEDAGAAYLFDNKGRLITTFFSPKPQALSNFGSRISAVGNRVAVSAYRERQGDTLDAGAVYLYDQTGALVERIISPNPTESQLFGWSLDGGDDFFVVGATGESSNAPRSGAVFVYNDSGQLERRIGNPTPAENDSFSSSVSVQDDRIFISAPLDDARGEDVGSIYVYGREGSLRGTLQNPRTVGGEGFGLSLATSGSGVAVGLPNMDNGLFDSGGVLLYDAAGRFVDQITNPNPSFFGGFGTTVAAVGANFAVGDPTASVGVSTTGTAYLFAGPEALPGDANLDGAVDISDFARVKNNFGDDGSREQGDFTGDGHVGLSDFNVLKDNFGRRASVIPEPSAILLAALGFGFVLTSDVRPRNRRSPTARPLRRPPQNEAVHQPRRWRSARKREPMVAQASDSIRCSWLCRPLCH